MRCLYVLIFALGSLCAASGPFSLPNVNATFAKNPKPFRIHVDRGFIEDTRQRVAHARAPLFINVSSDGPGAENFTNVRNFWVSDYDWNATEASINNRSDAIPLLFIHVWPGSFLEVSNIIGNLKNPPNASVPAFHVVAPSIPGFGLSPAPMQQPGFGPAAASYAFNELMLQLGYSRYVIQGGDFGDVILRYQAHNFPKNVISALSNFWIIQPGNNDLRRLAQGEATPDEVAYIEIIEKYENQGSGYRLIMSTEPLTVAYGMTDSPLGNAMWMYSIMNRVIDPIIMAWTPEEIITWSMMYWIQGPYGGMRFYK
ncbi:epoxide hydrolase [Fusarium agapanthi]|uniref:Epoxide hydrolase n=1 Tax=Fusarium agapanthi TaxID=1803897 RepID=A0A9P5B783_9HYPO|nr:epoxide hydrolase [Fusarium agapanthi]